MYRAVARRLTAAVVAVNVVHAAIGTRVARAQESPASEVEECFTAAERAQPLMRERKLSAARAKLEVCARDSCPAVARSDCRNWLAEVANLQPSVVIAPHELLGPHEARDVAGVRAIIDGNIVIERVEPAPIEIDPGPHLIRLERAGAEPLEQKIDVREGEKNRVVDLYWPMREAAQAYTRPVPPGVYVTGALGVVTLGVGAYFEAVGFSRRNGLEACKASRSCTQADVDSARDLMRIGDLTIGAGILLLAGTALTYFTRPAEPTLPGARVGWMLAPMPGGCFAGVRGHL